MSHAESTHIWSAGATRGLSSGQLDLRAIRPPSSATLTQCYSVFVLIYYSCSSFQKKSFQIWLNSDHTSHAQNLPRAFALFPVPAHVTQNMPHLQIGLIPGTAIGGFIGGALVTNLVIRLSSPPIRRGLFVRRRSHRPCPRCGGFGLAKCTLCSGNGICVSDIYTPMSPSPYSSGKDKRN